MEIKIFNSSLEFVGIIEKFDSFDFTQVYNDKGTFVLKVPFSVDGYELLKKNYVVCYNGLTGIIESITADLSDAGTITINGYEITYILNRRIIWNDINFTGTIEEFCRKIVNDNCIECDETRIIPFLELGDVKNIEYMITKQTAQENLFKTLVEVCQLNDIGFRIVFDIKNKKLVFEVFEGRSTDNTYNRDWNNINSLTYVTSYNNYANVARISAGDDTAKTYLTIGDYTGLDRYEIAVKSSKKKENNQSESDYIAVLKQEGNEKLSKQTAIETLDAEIADIESNVELGDKVTVVDKQLGLKMTTFVSQIENIYDGTGYTKNIVFGYDVPSIYKKVI